MKVLIQSPGPLDVSEFSADGEGVEVVPHFYGRGKEGIVATVRVFDSDGEMLRAAKLVVCGSTGKIGLQDRSDPKKAARERESELEAGTSKP